MPTLQHHALQKIYESSKSLYELNRPSRVFKVTYPDGNTVCFLGAVHLQKLKTLSKEEILAIDGSDYIIGEELEPELDADTHIRQGVEAFLRDEKDEWFKELEPKILLALKCLWQELCGRIHFPGAKLPDITYLNRCAAFNYIETGCTMMFFRSKYVSDLKSEHVIELDEIGMDYELDCNVFLGVKDNTAFDNSMERDFRVFSTANLQDDYLDYNKLLEDDFLSMILLFAQDFTSFKTSDKEIIAGESVISRRISIINKLKKSILDLVDEEILSVNSTLKDEEDDTNDGFNDLRKCNVKWTKQLCPIIKSRRGVGLVAVGASHLPGEHGMLTLLQRFYGYTVERLSVSGWAPWFNEYMAYIQSYRELRESILYGSFFHPFFDFKYNTIEEQLLNDKNIKIAKIKGRP